MTAQGVTLLNEIGSKIVAQNKSFDEWTEKLTTVQRNFVQDPKRDPLSILGPAGSGKTLCLALYAIKKSRDTSKKPRICFITQNWSQAYMIDSLVQVLGFGTINHIHVYPLLYVIRSIFNDVKSESSDYKILIEDSVDGKLQNFGFVQSALQEAIANDLPLITHGLSDSLRARIEGALSNRRALNTLTWDVMNEFASVLSVNRIRPGVTAATRYRALPRASWMMPLQSNEDKDLILAAYSRYVRKLECQRVIAYDQLLSDYISKFDTFEWDRRRITEGYDIVLIDEYHLYTDIERSIIPYLYCDPNTYPWLVMASDPMQSPTDILKGVEFANKEKVDGRNDKSRGIHFQVFKRYSKEIEAFVTHLYNSYPTILANDRLLIEGYSSALSSSKPKILIHQSHEEALQAITRSLNSRDNKEQTTHAVICLSVADLTELEEFWKDKQISAIFIKDPSDFDLMKYSSKKIPI